MSARYESGGFHLGAEPGYSPFGITNWNASANQLNAQFNPTQRRQYGAQTRIFADAAGGGFQSEQLASRRAMANGGRDSYTNYMEGQALGFDRGMLNRSNNQTDAAAARMGGDYAIQRQRGGQMYNQGMGMMNADYSGVQQQQLGLMRQQAAPQEERQSNALAQKMFGMGQIGTEGGARQMEAFGTGLANADINRQMQSMQFAQGLRNQDQNVGMNMINAGNTANQSGFTMDQQRQQMQMGNYTRGMDFDRMNINRGQQRMANSQGMFQFGQNIRGVNEARMGSAQQSQLNMSNDMRQNVQMMNSIRNGAGAGGNTSDQTSPWAAAGAELLGGAAGAYLPGFIDSIGNGGGAGGGGVSTGSGAAWNDNFGGGGNDAFSF